MFDDDRVTAELSAFSPYRRAVVATLAARRAAVVADTTADETPAAAEQLTEAIKKIDPTVERFDTAFWDSAATAVASGAYARR